MLILFETSAGYALFKVTDESKLVKLCRDAENGDFGDISGAEQLFVLKGFQKFQDMTDALSETTALVEGACGSIMKEFLEKNFVSKGLKEKLVLSDKNLATSVHKALGIDCEGQTSLASEATRLIRSHFASLLPTVPESTMTQMNLGLAHSLSRYKLKFSPDKVDTMIVQAVSLLDDLDKELNTYAMRAREWYGWHFPELAKVVNDNETFCKVVLRMGFRTNATSTDFTGILEEDVAQELKDVAQVSMGTEISNEDLENIGQLCDQVINIGKYRKQLSDYLHNRMMAIAPNLTALVGDLVGARLIAHCGSLMALAKNPASTIQILGAEKALFRAMKTKHETPKYGLLYNASLVGQASQKHKGKIARVLAAKCALAIRVDALGDSDTQEIGEQARAKVEDRLRALESRSGFVAAKSAGSEKKKQIKKYEPKVEQIVQKEQTKQQAAPEMTLDVKKRPRSDADGDVVEDKVLSADEAARLKKQKKKEKKEKKKEKKEKKKEKKEKK